VTCRQLALAPCISGAVTDTRSIAAACVSVKCTVVHSTTNVASRATVTGDTLLSPSEQFTASASANANASFFRTFSCTTTSLTLSGAYTEVLIGGGQLGDQ